MEKLFKLRTKDGHNIHGILNFKNRLPNKCVIFVHGLTGKPNNHWFYNAKNYFVQKGYAVIRFYLYTDLPQARQLDQCTLAIHSQDLNQVIDYARRKGFKSLSLVGHSLGGPTILNAKTKNLSSLVFWDPLFNPQQFIKDVAIFDKQMNAYILKWGVTHILGKPMYQELCNVTHYKTALKENMIPIKIIAAGKGFFLKDCRQYYQHARSQKSLVVIAGATHCFDEEGTASKLFKESHEWIAKHQPNH